MTIMTFMTISVNASDFLPSFVNSPLFIKLIFFLSISALLLKSLPLSALDYVVTSAYIQGTLGNH